MLIVDPVSAYLGKVDSYKNAEVRALLSLLATMAKEAGVAILAISHFRKGEGRVVHQTMGSLVFVVTLLENDKNDGIAAKGHTASA